MKRFAVFTRWGGGGRRGSNGRPAYVHTRTMPFSVASASDIGPRPGNSREHQRKLLLGRDTRHRTVAKTNRPAGPRCYLPPVPATRVSVLPNPRGRRFDVFPESSGRAIRRQLTESNQPIFRGPVCS